MIDSFIGVLPESLRGIIAQSRGQGKNGLPAEAASLQRQHPCRGNIPAEATSSMIVSPILRSLTPDGETVEIVEA
jgi:hypothetical protein